MVCSPRDGAYNFLRTQHFHGVSSGNRHTYLLKSRYGKVSSFRLTLHTGRIIHHCPECVSLLWVLHNPRKGGALDGPSALMSGLDASQCRFFWRVAATPPRRSA